MRFSHQASQIQMMEALHLSLLGVIKHPRKRNLLIEHQVELLHRESRSRRREKQTKVRMATIRSTKANQLQRISLTQKGLGVFLPFSQS